ncbi:MAG: hypothetical protein ABEJ83_03585 [Candidatus Nanohaloarchaea archaeon]
MGAFAENYKKGGSSQGTYSFTLKIPGRNSWSNPENSIQLLYVTGKQTGDPTYSRGGCMYKGPVIPITDSESADTGKEQDTGSETGDQSNGTGDSESTEEGQNTGGQDQGGSGSTEETSLTIENRNVQAGNETVIQVHATQDLANQGHILKIEGPETLTESFNQRQTSYTFTPQKQTSYTFTPQKTGEYTVRVLPQVFGQNIPLIGELLQGGAITKKTITVTETSPSQIRWIQYCQNKINEQVIPPLQNWGNIEKCLKNHIVPNYFQNSVGENVEVAQSLCQDILNMQYNRETKKCTT